MGIDSKYRKNAKLFFLKNIIFFFLFCILTKNGKSPDDKKIVWWSNVQVLTSYAEINLQSKAGNESISLSYQF